MLNSLRKKIDKIDKKIVKLFIKRMECSKKIAKIKLEKNISIADYKREKEVLNSRLKDSYKYSEYVKMLFSVIMNLSKTLQYELSCDTKVDKDELLTIEPRNIACQGAEGSYSNKACTKEFPSKDIKFYEEFEDVFKTIKNEEADVGVLPIENSSRGSVLEIYDFLGYYKFFIISSINVKVDHCISAVKGPNVNSINTVYSHNQAISQCSKFIKENKLSVVYCNNTAQEAKEVSLKKDYSCAAICSKEAAQKYGLEIIKENIQDNLNNYTRFIVVSKRKVVTKEANKISICFSLDNTPGALNEVLMQFSALNINIVKIESRSVIGKSFEYLFYVDFIGNIHSKNVSSLIFSLSKKCKNFLFLGNYFSE